MFKMKTTLVAAALASTVAFGGAMAAQATQANNNMRYGVGFAYNANTDDAYSISFQVKDSMFEAGVGAGIARISDADEHSTVYALDGFFGIRHALRSHVIGSVGVAGNYDIVANGHTSTQTANTGDSYAHPYTVGAYVGVAYEPNSNLELFARIMPVSYTKDADTQDITQFFTAGQAGVAYFF